MSTSISSLPNELSMDKKDPVTLNVKEKNTIIQQNMQQNMQQQSQQMSQQMPPQMPPQMQQSPQMQQALRTAPAELSKDSINKIIQGLQDAGSSTSLQSRDIPMSMEQITHDHTARPNFVPTPSVDKMNYIQDEETMETLIKQKKEKKDQQMEYFYDEIQTPLLVMVMFFVFQLPIFKKSMVSNFAAFFQRSGNYNLKGMVFTTILFGGTYYSIIKTIKYLSEL